MILVAFPVIVVLVALVPFNAGATVVVVLAATVVVLAATVVVVLPGSAVVVVVAARVVDVVDDVGVGILSLFQSCSGTPTVT